MEKILVRPKALFDQEMITVLTGCLMIILGALIKIPFFPISFTLQTLVIYMLALSYSPRQAAAQVCLYLGCASIGLPVLSGLANPLWFIGKSAGYLIAFPMAAYLIAKLKDQYSPLLSLSMGALLILGLGCLHLSTFIGLKSAFVYGLLIFIPAEMFKILFVLSISKKHA